MHFSVNQVHVSEIWTKASNTTNAIVFYNLYSFIPEYLNT